jgi:hypothetical protein
MPHTCYSGLMFVALVFRATVVRSINSQVRVVTASPYDRKVDMVKITDGWLVLFQVKIHSPAFQAGIARTVFRRTSTCPKSTPCLKAMAGCR